MTCLPAAGALVLALTGTLAPAGGPVGDGARWTRVCPGERVCFTYPPGLQPVSGQPIDSLAGRYQGQEFSLSYDLGPYASDFSELESPLVAPYAVDGRPGTVLVSGRIMGLHVPRVSEGVGFAMALRFKETVDQELGHRIFSSVEFLSSQE